MKSIGILLIIALTVATGCRKGDDDRESALISKGFVDDSTYSIVCRGYPKDDLTGVGKSESAKRAALLTAYYYAKQVFDDTVAPDRDGKVDKYELGENSATVFYIISKGGLKNRVRK